MTKQRRTEKTTANDRPQAATEQQQPPQSGVQLVLVLNGEQAGGQFMPLPDTYVQAEQGLQSLFAALRDVLARLYEDRARQIAVAESQRAVAESQRAAGLEAEIERLKAQLAAAMEGSP